MIYHDLEMGSRLHTALHLYCLLQRAGVRYIFEQPEDEYMTRFEMQIRTTMHEPAKIVSSVAGGWQLPGNHPQHRTKRQRP